MSTIDKVLLDTDTNDEFIRQLMGAVVLATKESNAVPKGTDYHYHSMFPEFATGSANVVKETRELITRICKNLNPDEFTELPVDAGDPVLYDQIVDYIDTLLEGADESLRKSTTGDESSSKLQNMVNQNMRLDKDRIMKENVKFMTKPQLNFMTEIDNTRRNPFRPRLQHKYHASEAPLNLNELPRSLQQKNRQVGMIEEEEDNREIMLAAGSTSPGKDEEDNGGVFVTSDTYFAHPYEAELVALAYPSWCHRGDDVEHLNSMPTYAQQAPLFVDARTTFATMMEHLRTVDEVAVDLEHHSFHTFQGITCLMQISSRDQDFVVDTLALRSEIHQLGEVIANPRVVKVLHGCDKDVLWLQRDFGLYVVNCFDTHVAAKVLEYPALSLAHLLKMHCGVVVDKKHQLSDWRQRPLPPEMLHYATEDTRYLLYVYDRMRQQLWKSKGIAGLEVIFDASKQICLSRYEKPAFNPLGFRKLFNSKTAGSVVKNGSRKKSGGGNLPLLSELTSLQVSALSALWDWRDQAARDEDESETSIMSNAELLRIGLNLPRNAIQLEQLCAPLSSRTRTSMAEIVEMLNHVTKIGPSKPASSSNTATPQVIIPNTANAAGKRRKARNEDERQQQFTNNTVATFIPVLPASSKNDSTTAIGMGAVVGTSSAEPAAKAIQQQDQHRESVLQPPAPADIRKLFVEAGWSTPHQELQDPNLMSCSPLIFESNKTPEISEENKYRMQKSREELAEHYASYKDFHTMLNDLTAPNTAGHDDDARGVADTTVNECEEEAEEDGNNNTATGTSSRKNRDNSSPDDTTTTGIPRSFEEVYVLSKKNRQRNKDKKKQPDGSTNDVDATTRTSSNSSSSLPSAAAVAASGTASARANVYFNAPATTSSSAEALSNDTKSTLAFAKSIGWIADDEESATIEAAHLEDLACQQAEGGISSSQDEFSASHDKGSELNSLQQKSSGGGSGSSNSLRKSGDKQQHHRGNSNNNNSTRGGGTGTKAFDYSKVPRGGMSMGALPAGATTTAAGGGSGRGGGGAPMPSKSNKKGKNDASSSNPFLFGGRMGK